MARRTPRRAGRPLALTPDIETRFLNAIRSGVPGRHAAAHAGITQRSIENYAARVRYLEDEAVPEHQYTDDDRTLVRFITALTKARADGVARNVGLIQKAAAGGFPIRTVKRTLPDGTVEEETVLAQPDWRAGAFILERVYPQDFGKNAVQVEFTGAPAAVEDDAEPEVPQGELVASLSGRLAAIAARRAESGEDDVADAEIVD